MISLVNNKTFPYLINCAFPYNPSVLVEIKQIPAAKWWPGTKTWTIPIEFIEQFKHAVRNIEPVNDTHIPEALCDPNERTQFQSGYQHIGSLRGAYTYSGFIYNYVPGLGKTASAIETARLLGIKRALIVSPAMVRRTWRNEFNKWWKDRDDDITILTEGKRKTNSKKARLERECLAYGIDSGLIITSYGLLESVEQELCNDHQFQPEAIIFDEVHNLQNPKSKQYSVCEAVVAKYPKARRLGLTGTLFTNGIINAWGPLNILFPHRWDSRHDFGVRYTQANKGEYGWQYLGVNEEHLEELKWRLSLVSLRATEEDLIKEGKGSIPTLSLDEIDEVEDEFSYSEWLRENISTGSNRIVILSYFREKAHEIAAIASKIAKTICLTGEITSDKRFEELEEEVKKDRPLIVVANISAIKIGVNVFKEFPLVLFSDLSDNLEEMEQVFRRFQRKGSTLSRVRGYALTNAITRPKALRLKKKLKAIAAVQSLGTSGGSLQEAFNKQNEFTADEWQAAIDSILGSKSDVE